MLFPFADPMLVIVTWFYIGIWGNVFKNLDSSQVDNCKEKRKKGKFYDAE